MKEVRRYLEDRLGKYSFYFEDLKSGFIYGYNEHVKMTSAGCMKLPVALAVIREVEEGKISLNDPVLLESRDRVEGSGILKHLNSREYTVNELVIVMLVESDNTATQKLVSLIGFDELKAKFLEMGLEDTTMNDMPGSPINLTTSYDLSLCWKLLKGGEFLSREHSRYIIELLKSENKKKKTGFYLDESLKEKIASKAGDMPGVENDTTLIELQKGDFVFTIMSSDLPNSVYGLVSLAKSGKMIWDGITYNWK
ncbi:serine hydrolase [Proteiniclasticum sp.]|uniref:serine hydrolase n=1 Tax=Proteiniclasticum sp. TaxID=2053595 RepID=UPI00289EDD2A|nr:serine hydrolase [Proteiniclasticum sp.]